MGSSKTENRREKVAIALGITGILWGLIIPILPVIISVVLGVIAVVLGYTCRNNNPGSSMWIAGIVLGVIAILIGVAVVVLYSI